MGFEVLQGLPGPCRVVRPSMEFRLQGFFWRGCLQSFMVFSYEGWWFVFPLASLATMSTGEVCWELYETCIKFCHRTQLDALRFVVLVRRVSRLPVWGS